MNEVAKGPLRFTGIETANWRNFGQATVRLQNRVFLVGPNASGKSNFLDIFRFLREIASVGGGFQAAVQNRGGVSSLRSLSARRYPDISLVATIGTGTGPDSWEYGLSFTQDSRRRPFIQHEHVARGGEELWSRPSEEDLRDRERLTQTYIEQVSLNREFRELVEFLASVRYLHLVPQLVRDPDRSAGRKGDPYGGDFLEQLARTQERIRIARLRRIREALRVAVPQLSELDLFRDERGIPHLRGKYLNWRREGAWQTEERFSDGTLRLLGLLWSIQDGNGPLLLEEPELSLHPEIVRHIPLLFAQVQKSLGRQIIVSTHSPELLMDEGIGLDEVLLLVPEREGTSVSTAKEIDQVDELLAGGLSLADVVIPNTRPKNAAQLSLLDFG